MSFEMRARTWAGLSKAEIEVLKRLMGPCSSILGMRVGEVFEKYGAVMRRVGRIRRGTEHYLALRLPPEYAGCKAAVVSVKGKLFLIVLYDCAR